MIHHHSKSIGNVGSVAARQPWLRAVRSLCWAVVISCASSACSSLDMVETSPQWDREDREQLFRLHVVVAPAPLGDARIGGMIAAMAKRYANHHRDFIVKAASVAPHVDGAACAETIEGLLHLSPSFVRTGAGADVRIHGRLLRCRDGKQVWEAVVDDDWDSADANLAQVQTQYQREFGSFVGPYVAPAFHALRALLDSLPRPKLVREADIDEKIEVGQ